MAYVAVIEDEPTMLGILCDVVSLAGEVCLGVSHPAQLDTLATHPDLFLVDLMLPERSGIEVARNLREEGYIDTPMLAMSASDQMVASARLSGLFQDVLSKPFDIDQLLVLLDRYLHAP